MKAAGVVALCSLPSAALNVWPKVPQIVKGAATGSDVAYVVIVLTAVLLMAAVPFAAKKANNIGWKALFWGFGFALATLNYSLAVASVGKMRDSDAGPARELVHKAAGLDSRMAWSTNSRKQLPKESPAVDQAMLDAANQGVSLAEEARRQECGKVGDNCRKRVEELAATTKERTSLLAAKAVADRIAKLDDEIRQLESERQELGPVPKDVDAAATRLSKQLGKIIDLGDNPVEATADILIASLSAFAELIGLLGPVIFLTAMSTEKEDRPARGWSWRWRRREKAAEPPATTPAPAPEAAGLAPSPATPAKAKKPRKIKAAGVRDVGDVREWKESRTVVRVDSRIKPGDAYAAHKMWCIQEGKEPVSLTAFGTTMKGDPREGGLGIPYEERNKRGFYVGIALVGAPTLVAREDPIGMASRARA